MKRLEEMTFGQRIILTVIIVLVIVFALALVGWTTGRWSQEAPAATEEQLYQGIPLNAHLLALDKIALETAYQEHARLLFSVWLKDDISVVHRINTGLRKAREAYGHAATRIEEREKALAK